MDNKTIGQWVPHKALSNFLPAYIVRSVYEYKAEHPTKLPFLIRVFASRKYKKKLRERELDLLLQGATLAYRSTKIAKIALPDNDSRVHELIALMRKLNLVFYYHPDQGACIAEDN